MTPIDQKKGGHPKPGSCDPRHSRRDSQPGTVQVPIWVICRVNLFCCRRVWQRFCTECLFTIRSPDDSRKGFLKSLFERKFSVSVAINIATVSVFSPFVERRQQKSRDRYCGGYEPCCQWCRKLPGLQFEAVLVKIFKEVVEQEQCVLSSPATVSTLFCNPAVRLPNGTRRI